MSVNIVPGSFTTSFPFHQTCDKQPNNYVLIGFTFVSKGAIMPLLASY